MVAAGPVVGVKETLMPSPVVSLDTWLVQNLRLTLFLQRPLEGIDQIWASAIGETPESDENRPRDGFRRITLGMNESVIELQVTAARADLLIGPMPIDPAALSQGMTPRGDFGSAADQFPRFDDIVGKFLAAAKPQALRIAVGVALAVPTSDRLEAYSFFPKLVQSLRVDASAVREVFYRVNRPAQSSVVAALELNRITAWHSLIMRMAVASAPIAAPATLIERHFFRLEIDNSTPADRTSLLENPTLGAIFRELVNLAKQNAEFGECP
jgi:hypothetical protein